MTSVFAIQKSSIKCQQNTTVKLKNVLKHNNIIPCLSYSLLIARNQQAPYHKCTKISISLTYGPFDH